MHPGDFGQWYYLIYLLPGGAALLLLLLSALGGGARHHHVGVRHGHHGLQACRKQAGTSRSLIVRQRSQTNYTKFLDNAPSGLLQ